MIIVIILGLNLSGRKNIVSLSFWLSDEAFPLNIREANEYVAVCLNASGGVCIIAAIPSEHVSIIMESISPPSDNKSCLTVCHRIC